MMDTRSVKVFSKQFNLKPKSYLRGLLSALKVSVNINQNLHGIILDRAAQHRGKVNDAITVLSKNNVDTTSFSYVFSPPQSAYIKIERFLIRAPKIIFLAFKYCKEITDGNHFFTLVLYHLVHSEINKSANSAYLLISDLSLNRYAFAGAFRNTGNQIIWFQHTLDLKVVPDLLINVDYAILKNDAGLKYIAHSLSRKDKLPQLFYDAHAVQSQQIYHCKEVKSIGIGVNAWFEPNERVLQKIKKILNHFDLVKVNLLLHPRTAKHIVDSCYDIPFLNISPNNEDFFASSQLIVAGNTQLQLDAIIRGKPVIHTGGLDFDEFDYMQYCYKGLVFGVEQIELLDLELANSFYQSPRFQALFRELISNQEVMEKAKSLTDFIWVK